MWDVKEPTLGTLLILLVVKKTLKKMLLLRHLVYGTTAHNEAQFCCIENGHYRWFSRYVIAAILVDGKQKIAH